MHPGCDTVDVDASIIDVAEIFLKTAFKCLPVIYDNRLVGSITRQNILKALEKTANIENTKKPAKQSTKQQIHVTTS
jgi:predicted transcriptional regulator